MHLHPFDLMPGRDDDDGGGWWVFVVVFFFWAAGDISLSARAERSAVRRTTKRMNFKEVKVRRGGWGRHLAQRAEMETHLTHTHPG